MRNEILVISLNKRFRRFEKKVKSATAGILRILRKDNVFLEIFLADSGKMLFLNRKFRDKNKAANILSFKESKEFVSPPSKFKHLGEIYLELPITDYSMTQLLAHGILHLLGYSHNKKIDRIKMEKREKEICSSSL